MDIMSGVKRKHGNGDVVKLDHNSAMKKALLYSVPDEIFMTGKMNTFIKVIIICI